MQDLNVIIDGDPLIYSCGFGAETHVYELITIDPDGNMHQEMWSDGNEMKKWKAANITKGDWEFVEQEKIVTPLGEALAFKIIGGKLTDIVKRVKEETGQEIARIWLLLTGPGNFRETYSTIRPYKGNRSPDSKPYYYNQMRQHMIEHWAAEVIEGAEADDQTSILAHEHFDTSEYIVCTVDKDLDQIEGRHYNYQKDVFYEVDEHDGLMFFYQQALSGDSGDNIPGCYGIGAGKAQKFIQEQEALHTESNCVIPLEEFLWEGIVTRYKEAAKHEKNPYEGDLTPREQALETARLVYMQREERELWTPPGIPHEELPDHDATAEHFSRT